MSACLIYSSNEKTHSEWSLAMSHGFDLALLSDLCDKTFTRVKTSMCILVIHALIAHEFG
jgi:hypothetical protein